MLILRGSIRDGETARVVLEDGAIMVLPNHTESDVESDSDMWDEDDAVHEIVNGDEPGDMDLYVD